MCRDMTELDFPDASFEAICSFYAIIHVPRVAHAGLLRNFQRMLVPGGLALLSLGRTDSEADIEQDWLGAGATMYWSHFDRETNLRLLAGVGFEIVWERLVRESDEFGGGEHLFVLARKPSD
jgi:SAM-dependent methyltransferase